jgi:hypothetical protein
MNIQRYLLGISFFVVLSAHAADHPRMYVSDADLPEIRQKIETQAWAKESFSQIRSQVESYVDRHAADPTWIVSRLAMYWKEGERYTQCYLKDQNWDRGEGNAPVPTVRMPGMRTWNKYVNGWNMLLRPILVLDTDDCYEDGKGRDYYVRFLTQQSVSGQGTFDALFGSVAGGKRSGVCRFI